MSIALAQFGAIAVGPFPASPEKPLAIRPGVSLCDQLLAERGLDRAVLPELRSQVRFQVEVSIAAETAIRSHRPGPGSLVDLRV